MSSACSRTRSSAWSAARAWARTTCCGWRASRGSWPGPARASTTWSPSGWPSWATSRPRKEPGKTRERTVYSLTDKGLEALREYAATPVAFPAVKSDPLQRLLIADLVGEEVTRASMATLREDVTDLQERIKEMEERAEALPHRRKYLLIVVAHLRRLLDAHLELVDDVERSWPLKLGCHAPDQVVADGHGRGSRAREPGAAGRGRVRRPAGRAADPVPGADQQLDLHGARPGRAAAAPAAWTSPSGPSGPPPWPPPAS